MQVAQALLVLCEAELQGAGLEGCVAEVLEGGGDGDDLRAGPFCVGRLLVFGEVLVGVAGGVGGLVGGFGVLVACEFAGV